MVPKWSSPCKIHESESTVSNKLHRFSESCPCDIRGKNMGLMTMDQFPAWSSYFSILHSFQTDSRAHNIFYTMGVGSSLSGVKGGQIVQLTTNLPLVKRPTMVEVYLHSLHTYSRYLPLLLPPRNVTYLICFDIRLFQTQFFCYIYTE
jgi:hypothetical protein